ncbi:MAG: threonine ammonia-lyase, biosynthetic, partial [Pseudomonadota bacterium]
MKNDYLHRIENAKVYDVARKTELEKARDLSARFQNTILLKREDNQPVFSFKLRGAYNKMAGLSPAALKKGVIAASAGNHAQGVALAAAKLKCKAVIVMPITTPQVKIDAVKAHGGKWVELVLTGDSYSDAYQEAQLLQKKKGYTFIHPFDDPDVIAGQGTIAKEILDEHPEPIDAIFVAIGGGGLISGIGSYIKAIRPKIKVIGVQTVDSDAMKQSLQLGKRIELKEVGLFSDGTAVKLVGEETFRVTQGLVDEFMTVDTDSVCAAIKDVFVDVVLFSFIGVVPRDKTLIIICWVRGFGGVLGG